MNIHEITEHIDDALLNLRFKHSVEIGGLTYKAFVLNKDTDGICLHIECYDDKLRVGYVKFRPDDDALISVLTTVHPDYKRMGIATAMYAYAKMLGGDIVPSMHQLPPGKAMWKSWKKSGDAAHILPPKKHPK